jgi:hypothetical protein
VRQSTVSLDRALAAQVPASAATMGASGTVPSFWHTM